MRQPHDDVIVEQFRAGGSIDGFQRDRLLLLSTIDRAARQWQTVPLPFDRTGDALVVPVSGEPDWYLDVLQNPAVVVEIGTECYDAVAAAADSDHLIIRRTHLD